MRARLKIKFGLVNGQSLVEVLVAFAVSVIFSVAIISTNLAVQKASRSAKNNSVAVKLAQEYMEQVRIIRDRRGFDDMVSAVAGKGLCTSGVDLQLVTSNADPAMWSCIAGTETILTTTPTFTRKVVLANGPVAATSRLVTVTVSWTENELRSVSNQTYINKY